MKLLRILVLIILAMNVALAEENASDTTAAFPELSGPYFGLESPGQEAQQFAEGIISIEGVQHCAPAVSPDGREIYWLHIPERGKFQIMFTEEVGGRWTAPSIAPFSGKYADAAPVFAPDGKRLYFASTRPGGYGKMDIWYLNRSDSGWSEPINLGSPPNSENSESQPSVTSDGSVYFVTALEGVKWNKGIYRSRSVVGNYTEPELLNEAINTEHADIYPFIAPNESYLLFGSGRPGGNSGETDAYISYRLDDGSFGPPQYVDSTVNNGRSVSFPCVTPDGRYLLFNRFNEDGTDAFYWISSDILPAAKPASE